MVFILDPEYDDLPVPEYKGLRIIDHTKHNELEVLTEEFLANGGTITKLAPGGPPKKRKHKKTDFNPFKGLVNEAYQEY